MYSFIAARFIAALCYIISSKQAIIYAYLYSSVVHDIIFVLTDIIVIIFAKQ